MREKEFQTIDGAKYRCDMMSVRAAHRTWIKLCSTLGSPIVSVLLSDIDQDQDKTRLIIGAVSEAVQNLEGDVADRLIEAVFDGISVADGDNILELRPALNASGGNWNVDFERHFHGRVLTVYKVFAWAVQVNYRDFLDGAQSLGLVQGLNLGRQASSTHPTQTSSSGASSPQSSSTLA